MTQQKFSLACKTAIAKVKRIQIEEVHIADSEEFSLYGLDSLDVMNVLLEIEQATGISLGEVDMKACNTIEKLYAITQ